VKGIDECLGSSSILNRELVIYMSNRAHIFTNLALDKCADAAFHVPNNLNVLDFRMLGQVLREQLGELILFELSRKAEMEQSVKAATEKDKRIYLPTKTLAS